MVLPKSKNAVGLGNSLMNDRFGKGKGSDMRRGNHQQQIQRTGADGVSYVMSTKAEDPKAKMRSVTEEAALDEFLSTAELAGTDFTASRMDTGARIVHRNQHNPYLLSAAEERATLRKHKARRAALTVPRRPAWDADTTAADLDARERASLLDWRRGLAALQEDEDLLMTPFERNIEVWRQLWRVVERSDLIVQIVDARNPLLFRCEDLEKYVKEVDERKNNLLLVNKADMMSERQRRVWAEYFNEHGIRFRFFSAELARVMNVERGREGSEADPWRDEEEAEAEADGQSDELAKEARKIELQEIQDDEEQWSTEDELVDPDDASSPDQDEQTRILTTDELESLFLEHAPDIDAEHSSDDSPARKTTVGLVGYPNVGKSSTINALVGAKKVSVSATPGKTKHFQTIHLSPAVLLCDCPGLVFPNFATTKADLVAAGVLPIDQLREHHGPAGLVAQRIPQPYLEAVYGMHIKTRAADEGGTGVPTATELLSALAHARGFAVQGRGGAPDESRAARLLLKDYVAGRLPFVHPPPQDSPLDALEFNRMLYAYAHAPRRRQGPNTSTTNGDVSASADDASAPVVTMPGEKSQRIDRGFFARGQRNTGHMSTPWMRQYGAAGLPSGRQLSGRKMREMVALEKDVDPKDVRLGSGKKHFKGNKRRVKQQGGTYE